MPFLSKHAHISLVLLLIVAVTFLSITFVMEHSRVRAAVPASNTGSGDMVKDIYARQAPDFDFNLNAKLANTRRATSDQLAATDNLKAQTGATGMTVRWNDFGGSPDVIMNFASPVYTGTPEEAGRAFLLANSQLFGINDPGDLRLFSHRAALGGHLLRFQQTFQGIDVKDGGIGLVLNKNNRVVMASGPFFRDVSVNPIPILTASAARLKADADLAQFTASLPSAVTDLLAPGLGNLTQQAAPVQNLEPKLGIYPTSDGYKLVWKVAKFSTNPFGLYLVSIDAHTGETVARKDYVSQFQTQGLLPFTADVYPKYPTITDELKNTGKISVASNGTPLGQERVTLRKFDTQNTVTGLLGTLTGTHTVVNNALATKAPFAQAAKGTWHFRIDDPTNNEARTDEQNQLAEPAEHQDEINAFFFTTYLLEYIDYLHVGGDKGIGQGSFPDDYPNKTIPLPATVHIPNIYIALDLLAGELPDPTDPNFAPSVLGLDNAFALNLTSLIEALSGTKSPVVVNPTSYGHGTLFNDLALEGTVPYHEGMHAITSPIAGLEGEPEGGALNEGQADMWAFTITDNASLGDYVVNAFGLRDLYRQAGRNPDSLAYIRSANSTLKYSDIGTRYDSATQAYDFEEHYDGEIYMSTMWDIRQMLNRIYPGTSTYKRPQPKDGAPVKPITIGTEIFERDFLGSMYILGTTAPDTIVKSRDALIVADQLLYPSNSTDPAAPGKHRALIEQIFAAHELGSQALEVSGGQATISTQVTPFTAAQAAPAVPQAVKVAPASPNSLKITWNAASGAIAYQVLKRQKGFANRRLSNQDQFAAEYGKDRSAYEGIREFQDGDASTTGFTHVAYVSNTTRSYIDGGRVSELFAPRGLSNLLNHEYAVRAIRGTSTTQLGVSKLSGAATPKFAPQNVTKAIRTAISNASFANGVFSFNQTLTNYVGATSTDKTIYAPLEFRIDKISDPTVTVKNPDTNGNTFIYNQTLARGATSAAKRLEFNDPAAKIFTFDATIFGRAYTGTSGGTGTLAGDGSSEIPLPPTYSVFSEERTGTLLGADPTGTSGDPALTYGDPLFAGITYADIEVTTKSDALILDAALSSTTAVDLDFELRTMDGRSLASSAGATAAEHVSSRVEPNTKYILRVKGFANGPAEFKIISRQFLPQGSPNENAGTITPGASSNTSATTTPVGYVRFTINPLTRSITFRVF